VTHDVPAAPEDVEPSAEPEPVADVIAHAVDPVATDAPEPVADLTITDYDCDDDLEQPLPPVGLVYGLARGTSEQQDPASDFAASSGAWAGLGNEVAALTGAQVRPAKYAPPRDGRTLDLSVRRIRWDASITRDDLERIHAGVKEL
jgi:hypothetical protein